MISKHTVCLRWSPRKLGMYKNIIFCEQLAYLILAIVQGRWHVHTAYCTVHMPSHKEEPTLFPVVRGTHNRQCTGNRIPLLLEVLVKYTFCWQHATLHIIHWCLTNLMMHVNVINAKWQASSTKASCSWCDDISSSWVAIALPAMLLSGENEQRPWRNWLSNSL